MERFDPDGMARQLLAEHGPDAVVVAVLNADDEMDRGNVKGFRDWHAVAKCIRVFLGEPL
jgi:hypothetical protein